MKNLNTAPYWDILPKAQRTLWARLVSLPEHFVLYGGTALALQLGHRTSNDFDFFSAQPIDPRQLYETLDFVAQGRITQEERNTLTVQAETEDSQLLARTVEAIRKVPAVAVAPLGRIGEIAPGNPVLDPK